MLLPELTVRLRGAHTFVSDLGLGVGVGGGGEEGNQEEKGSGRTGHTLQVGCLIKRYGINRDPLTLCPWSSPVQTQKARAHL